jgi:protein-disulfide isomerase
MGHTSELIRRSHIFSAPYLIMLCILALGVASAADPQTTPAPHRVNPPPPARPVAESAAPVKAYGSSSAPITMEVFTDYECPTCRALFEQTLRPMIADYVAAGKVYLVHHDFPLPPPGHHYSGQAARWANAAARVGEFQAVEAALYDNQAALEANGSLEKYVAAAVSPDAFKRLQKQMQGCIAPGPTAKPGGVNFSPSRATCSLDTYIEQDILLGNKIGIAATPTYVITYKGKRLPVGSGFVSWPILKQFFDSLLGQ